MTQKLSTLFCILTLAATAANSLQKTSHHLFYTTDIIEVTGQTGLTLTWQEAEERHEHHCQEAEGCNPGESLLATHRAHLEFSNFNIKYHENRCIY